MRRETLLLILCTVLAGAACQPPATESALDPTDTLAPLVSMTPRSTATPVSSRTPIPTFTYTPSITPIPPTPSNTPTPTETPVIIGIVNSAAEAVNIRSGPGENFPAIDALNPGTGVTVLGQSDDGRWYWILMEDGTEGWISSSLLRVEAPPTPLPTATPSPDLTALALGTPLPTALVGGGTITPTPPRAAVTATPAGSVSPDPASLGITSPTPTLNLPIIDTNAIDQTATALSTGIVRPTNTASSGTGSASGATATFTPFPVGTTSGGGSGAASVRQGVDVFALCNNPSLGPAAPTNLAAGSTIDVFWAWYAATPQLIRQHLDAVTYEVRVDGTLLEWEQYTGTIQQQGNQYFVAWFVPFGPLNAGQHTITYRATWSTAISDGSMSYGPGTENPTEEGSCTFTVR